MKKFGFFGKIQRIQRYRCNQCGKTFADMPLRPFDELRIPIDLGCQALHLLVEGMGIRATERLTRLHRDTVMALLEVAGQKCARLLDRKLVDLKIGHVQVDELWCYVNCKQVHNTGNDPSRGDQYTFLAIDSDTKLIVTHYIGKRDGYGADWLMHDLRKRTPDRIQITTDGLQAYVGAVYDAFDCNVDFAQQTKVYAGETRLQHRYSPPEGVVSVKTQIHIGHPKLDRISTSHVERTNLSVRLFTRRFTRLTLGYSKTLTNLKYAVALFVAHFNFCRVHSAHKKTPAMAAGVTDRVWTIKDLLTC